MTNGTRRGWGVSVTPRPLFTRRKDPVPIVQEAGWSPRAGLDRCGKSRPPPGFDPRTVQSVASRYTDWATRPIKNTKALAVFYWNLLLAISTVICWHSEILVTVIRKVADTVHGLLSTSWGEVAKCLSKWKIFRTYFVENSETYVFFPQILLFLRQLWAQNWGTRWRSWLRHCATSRKVAGSIPDGVIGFFHWHNPSGRAMALGLTQPLTEMSTRNVSWG